MVTRRLRWCLGLAAILLLVAAQTSENATG
jgi:hypothetical protein